MKPSYSPQFCGATFQARLLLPDKIPKVEWRPIWEPSADVMVDQQIALFQAGLTGDLEARAKLGLPEEVWGNLANMRQGFDQTMPASAVSKGVASQLSPQLSASQRQLKMNGKSYVISEIPRQ